MEEQIETNNRSSFREVFKNKHFLVLWLGQVFSQLADKVLLLYLVILVTAVSSANSAVSGLFVVFTIPAMFVGSIAGVFVDRWNKKWILIISNIVRAILILILPLWDSSIVSIYIISFFISAATQFFAPAESTMIPALVEKKNLMAANSLFTTTMLASIIIGFSLGEPLISFTMQYKAAHWAIAGLYIISTIVLAFIKGNKQGVAAVSDKSKDFFGELKDGIVYLWNTPVVFSPILKQLVLFSAHAALSVLVIGFTRDILQLEEKYFGYILAAVGLGMILGAGLVVKYENKCKRDTLINAGCIIMGLLIVVISQVNSRTIVLILALFTGMAAAAIAVPSQTQIQENTPENMRGKVFGVPSVLHNTAMTLPAAAAGVMADIMGSVTAVMVVMGILTALAGLINRKVKGPGC